MSEHPVLRVFAEATQVIESKAHDYADDSNVFSNFEFVDEVLGGKGLSFLALIATKVARIQQLTLAAKRPMNESLYDSLLDLGNYAFLWAASLPPAQAKTVREAWDQAKYEFGAEEVKRRGEVLGSYAYKFDEVMANIEAGIPKGPVEGSADAAVYGQGEYPGLSEL